MEYKNYSKPFLYSVPTLSNSFDLTTYDAVWDAMDKEAIKAIKIPDNVEEIRKSHQKKLDSLIQKGYYKKLSEKTFSENNYYKHFIILQSLKGEFFLGLKKYGYNIENDVTEYYKKLSLHQTYLKIAVFCSMNYHLKNFKNVDIPKLEKILSKKGDIIFKKSQNKINILKHEIQQTQNLTYKLKNSNELKMLENYISKIEENAFLVRNYSPDQAMKIFLRYVNEIEFTSITFLKKVITFHLQQQKDKRAKHNKDRRNYEDRKRKRKLVTNSDINSFRINNYFRNNPYSTVDLAAQELKLDPKTIREHKKGM